MMVAAATAHQLLTRSNAGYVAIMYTKEYVQLALVKIIHPLCKHDNHHDRFVVAVLKEETECIVGHLSYEISRECYYCLKMDGIIDMKVTCILVFKHQEKEMMDRMKLLLKAKGYIGGKKSTEKTRSKNTATK